MNRILYISGPVLLFLAWLFFWVLGKYVDQDMNKTGDVDLSAVSQEARELHQDLLVADWHADNLLWDRNMLNMIGHGQVDLPRLISGGFAIQVFDAVIKTPRGINYERNDDSTDNITLLAIANRWPPRTWNSLLERALFQSQILHETAEESEGNLRIIKSKSDLIDLLYHKKSKPTLVGGLLSVEGLHALEKDLENVGELERAGFRILGLVHFFDNALGGSSAGVEKGGITDFGRQVIKKMEEKSLTVDLAHSSEKLFFDVLNMATRPVVVSHTGIKAIHDSPRNLSDKQILAIADNGGMIGIGFWDGANGDALPSSIAKAIRYVVDLVGIHHVSLGSDFDGAVETHFDASEMVVLTEALLAEGFNAGQIKLIMGLNQINFLLENLPEEYIHR
jgi:membrane dipeptidase